MKELLLDVIAHDLKNPAGVIKGFAELGLENEPNSEILKEIEKLTFEHTVKADVIDAIPYENFEKKF